MRDKTASEFTFSKFKQRQKLLQTAKKFEKNNRFDEAIIRYQKALEIHEPDFVLQNKIGSVLIEFKRYQKALSYFDRSLELNKKNPVALYNKGLIFYLKDNFKNATKFFCYALKFDKRDADSWHYLGHCYQELDQHRKAIDSFTKELEIDPTDDHSWCEKGNSLLEINKIKNAKHCFEKAISLNKKNNEAIANLGLCNYRFDKFEIALEYFNQAILLDKKDGFSYHYMGHCFQNLRQYEAAISYFKKELKTKENFQDTWYEIGISYFAIGDYPNSKNGFLTAIREDKTNHKAATKLSQVFRRLSEPIKANKYRDLAKKIRSIPKQVKEFELKHDKPTPEPHIETRKKKPEKESLKVVFIVHGHDDKLKKQVKKIVEPTYSAVILSERASAGKTIIEEFEKEAAPAEYAIALFTPDDKGKKKRGRKLLPRPRQNVIFELGFFIGKFGDREKAFVIRKNMEKDPEFSDHQGIIDIVVDTNGTWKNKLKKKLKINS